MSKKSRKNRDTLLYRRPLRYPPEAVTKEARKGIRQAHQEYLKNVLSVEQEMLKQRQKKESTNGPQRPCYY